MYMTGLSGGFIGLIISLTLLLTFIVYFIFCAMRQQKRENACQHHEPHLVYFDGPPYGMGRYGCVKCRYCGKSFSDAKIMNWRGAEEEARQYLFAKMEKFQ